MRSCYYPVGLILAALLSLSTPRHATAAGEPRDVAALSSVVASRAEAISGPLISTTPSVLSFGNVVIGQTAARTLTVHNVGAQNLSLFNVFISDPHFTSTFSSPVAIPSGGSVDYTISYTPTGLSSNFGTTTLVSDAQNGNLVVSMSGAGLFEAGAELGAGRILVAASGEAAGDQLGISVASAGDLNGDGFGDFLAGAWTNDAGGADAGRVYVYFGGATPDAIPDRILQGASANDNFGTSVASAGDVNGDGFPDIVVGAWGNDAGGNDAGRAYVYYGGPTMDSIADLILTGQSSGDRFGVSVSSAGDVNGDGFDDVLVGAFLSDVGGFDTGRAYVFFGGPGADANSDWVLTGFASGDHFGWSVAGAGDVNGDGFDDVLSAALDNDAAGISAGRAYLFFGGAFPNTTPDLTLTGAAAGDRFGVRLASAGDVNGDGRADFIIGADYNSAGGPGAGRAYVYHGGPGVDEIADLTLTGEVPAGNFGAAVSSAGDVNNDGFADLLVGAWLTSVPVTEAGRAYLFYGGPIGDAIADAVFTGEAEGDRFGDLVSSAGDVNGDGRDDLLIGAYFNDGSGAEAGRAYVVSLVDTQAPTVSAPTGVTGATGTPISFDVTVTDPEGVGILSLSAAPLPAGASFTPNGTNTSGTFAWTPGALQTGNFTITFAASNGVFGYAVTTIVVGVGNQAPVVSGPAGVFASEGTLISFGVRATDSDGDRVTLGILNRPVGALFVDNGDNSGNFGWSPGFGQAGAYTVSFTGVDVHGAAAAPKEVPITVDNVNRAPVAAPGGPYAGVVNIPITFNGTGTSDPDGDALTYQWSFGDLGSGSGPTPLHAYSAGGVFAVTLTVADASASAAAATIATVQSVFPATAFLEGGNVTTRLNSGKAVTCVQIEPVNQSYLNTSVSVGSIVMISPGTGSVERISAIAGKTTIGGDRNRNGVDEIAACFSKTELRNLFSGLGGGRHTIGVVLEGDLTTGGRFRTTLEMDVVASGNQLAASVSPNPLNPAGVLTFRITRPGAVAVTMFDSAGRLVRTLLREPFMTVGYHDVGLDGHRDDGARLPSGVYFYSIETTEGNATGRVVVLK